MTRTNLSPTRLLVAALTILVASLAFFAGPASAEDEPEPNRADCDEIRGTEYLSWGERDWYLANCLTVAAEPAAVATATYSYGDRIMDSEAAAGYIRITAIGDSVMLGAASRLASTVRGIDVDAGVSRQVSAVVSILEQRRYSGELGGIVLLHVGNNGTFTRGQFEQLMEAIGPDRTAVFFNVKEPRSWEATNNAVIAEGVASYPNALLVDWYAYTIERPDLFWSDLIHLRPEGAALYADLVRGVVGE